MYISLLITKVILLTLVSHTIAKLRQISNGTIETLSVIAYKRQEKQGAKQKAPSLLLHEDQDNAFFGECKWTNEKVGVDVLEALIERARLFHSQNNHLYLLAKRGFTSCCMEKATARGNVTLVNFVECLDEAVPNTNLR